MKILFATSEALPFINGGKLSNVAVNLALALKEKRVNMRIIMPLYADIAPELREKMNFISSFEVALAWRREKCNLYSCKYEGISYYFVGNDNYYNRSGIYGHRDDALRFAFFSKAVLECVHFLSFKPDIIQCNDWQTALIPVFLNCFYKNDEALSHIRTLFTIHNIEKQGVFGNEVAGDVCGLTKEKQYILEYKGKVNFMKGAIDQCDVILTVSPTYAGELLAPTNSHGLEKLLKERGYKLAGIQNGIDINLYDPKTDPFIAENYSSDDISGKEINKKAIQRELGVKRQGNNMLIGIVSRMVSQKGMDLISTIAKEMMELPIELVALGYGDYKYESFFRELSSQYPEKVRMVTGFDSRLARRIYAGADVFLMPSQSEPCGISQMIALRYGAIPIVRETGALKDSVRDIERDNGNGFTFKEYDAKEMMDTIKRALMLFENKEEWEKAVRGAMESDNSWGHFAGIYKELYKRIIARGGEHTIEDE